MARQISAVEETLAEIEALLAKYGENAIFDRVHPRIATHPQANARLSTTDPPMATTPADLRDLYMPDPEWPWFGWDWDGQELRILAALAGDQPLLEAFRNGWDVHSMNTRDIFFGTTEASRYATAHQVLIVQKDFRELSIGSTNFLQQLVSQFKAGVYGAVQEWLDGLPTLKKEWETCLRASAGHEGWPGRGCTPSQWKEKRQSAGEFTKNNSIRARTTAYAAWVICGGPPPDWLGKEDLRRTFAKRFVYRLNYGGDPRTAGNLPGANTLGLTPKHLIAASRAFLLAHPALASWRRRTEIETTKTHIVRAFTGRRRVLFSKGKQAVREAFDYPMQAGGAEMLIMTILGLDKEFRGVVRYIYSMHDSLALGVHRSIWTPETWLKLADLAERTWMVNNHELAIPATFFVRDGAPTKREWKRTEAQP